jgi:hypothetical protein
VVEGRNSKSGKLILLGAFCSMMYLLGVVKESLANIAVGVVGYFTFITVIKKAGDMARELLKISIGLVPGVVVDRDKDFRNLNGVIVKGSGVIFK